MSNEVMEKGTEQVATTSQQFQGMAPSPVPSPPMGERENSAGAGFYKDAGPTDLGSGEDRESTRDPGTLPNAETEKTSGDAEVYRHAGPTDLGSGKDTESTPHLGPPPNAERANLAGAGFYRHAGPTDLGSTKHKEKRRSVVQAEDVEPWAEVVNGAALLDELRETLHRHVVLPPHGSETLALWVLHTYAFELRSITTYVGVVSPEKRCGKTTLLSLLARLANRPIVASNISPPALFRVIEEVEPTLIIDEADSFLQGNEEMRGILNAGYSRETAYVVRVANQSVEGSLLRVERGDGSGGPRVDARCDRLKPGLQTGSRLVRFSCWCPKVMAAIGRLPETLADRCIVLTMQRKKPREECGRLRNLDATTLRSKCARFVADHADRIVAERPQGPETLNDRALDIWEPLLVLADLAGGEWPRLAREAAVRLSAIAQEGSPMSVLLMDVALILAESDGGKMFSRDLVGTLNAIGDRPWEVLRSGKRMTELCLANLLRPYGVRPKSVWIGEQSAKGYAKEDFMDVVGRYSAAALKQLMNEWGALDKQAEERRA